MKRLVICLAVSLAATPAAAQRPRVPVPLTAAEDYGACSTAQIRAPLGTDGLVSVRAGPSRRERALAHLPDERDVYACVRRGDWFGIVFEKVRGGTQCADVVLPRRANGVYRGPCLSGWVHYNYLVGYADWISP
jgi:hypothetical protein